MDRFDFYYRQRVTEAEIDSAFDAAEIGDWNLVRDHEFVGIVQNGDVSEHAPTPDLTVDISGPGIVYDADGHRIEWPTDDNVDCSVDENSLPTTVTTPGNERWLSIFCAFERELSDPRTDGNGATVYAWRAESFVFHVVQGAEAPIGTATRPTLRPDEILLADVRIENGDLAIPDARIDITRRQDLVVIAHGPWSIRANTIGEALDDLLEVFETHHASGGHPAVAIDFTPHSWIAATDVQAALEEVVDDLALQTAGLSGARAIGWEGYATGWHDGHSLPAATVQASIQEIVEDLRLDTGNGGADRIGAGGQSGSPNGLSAGSIFDQLGELLGHVNDHENDSAGAHAASAISFSSHSWIGAGTVQAAIEEIVDDLSLQTTTTGAARIGFGGSATFLDGSSIPQGHVENALDQIPVLFSSILPAVSGAHKVGAAPVSGSPNSLGGGSVNSQLASLLADINDHENESSGAHAASAISSSAHSWIAATDVQSAIEEIVDDLGSTASASGGDRIGCEAQTVGSFSVSVGTLTAQINELLTDLDNHQTNGVHDLIHIGQGTHGQRSLVHTWGNDPFDNGTKSLWANWGGGVSGTAGMFLVGNLEWDQGDTEWDVSTGADAAYLLQVTKDRLAYGRVASAAGPYDDDDLTDFALESGTCGAVGSAGSQSYDGLWRYSAGECGFFGGHVFRTVSGSGQEIDERPINFKTQHKSVPSSITFVTISESSWDTTFGSNGWTVDYISNDGAWIRGRTDSISEGNAGTFRGRYITVA